MKLHHTLCFVVICLAKPQEQLGWKGPVQEKKILAEGLHRLKRTLILEYSVILLLLRDQEVQLDHLLEAGHGVLMLYQVCTVGATIIRKPRVFPLNPIINQSSKMECCGDKTHQINQNMILSQGLELKVCCEGQLSQVSIFR